MTPSIKRLFPKCLLTIFLRIHIKAISTSHVKIVGTVDGIPQYLPSSYVTSFPRWTLENGQSKILKGSDGSNQRAHGFVNPTSIDELWWPLDMKQLEVRPTVDVLLRKGIPSYAMAGIQVRVPPHVSKNGEAWYNFGLNSQPLAMQWTGFDMTYESDFRVAILIGRRKGQQSNHDHANSEILKNDGFDWKEFQDQDTREGHTCRLQIKKALQSLGLFLADTDSGSPLLEGIHVLSVPTTDRWLALPSLAGHVSGTYRLACIATSEPDAPSILNIDEVLIDISGTSVLRVDVSHTGAGSESEYLPPVYRPLYLERT